MSHVRCFGTKTCSIIYMAYVTEKFSILRYLNNNNYYLITLDLIVYEQLTK